MRNNPLNSIDPSGYFNLKQEARNFGRKIKKFAGMLITAALGPAGLGWSGFWAGAAGGAVSAKINGGNMFKAGLSGAISGALFAKAGNLGEGLSRAGRIRLHAFAGGLSGFAGGAIHGNDVRFSVVSGALSGGLGKFATTAFNVPGGEFHLGQAASTGLAGAIGGGLASSLYGRGFRRGFRSGFETAAMGYVMNQLGEHLQEKILNDWEYLFSGHGQPTGALEKAFNREVERVKENVKAATPDLTIQANLEASASGVLGYSYNTGGAVDSEGNITIGHTGLNPKTGYIFGAEGNIHVNVFAGNIKTGGFSSTVATVEGDVGPIQVYVHLNHQGQWVGIGVGFSPTGGGEFGGSVGKPGPYKPIYKNY